MPEYSDELGLSVEEGFDDDWRITLERNPALLQSADQFIIDSVKSYFQARLQCSKDCEPRSDSYLINLDEEIIQKYEELSSRVSGVAITTGLHVGAQLSVAKYEPNFDCAAFYATFPEVVENEPAGPNLNDVSSLEEAQLRLRHHDQSKIYLPEINQYFPTLTAEQECHLAASRVNADVSQMPGLFNETFQFQLTFDVVLPRVGKDLVTATRKYRTRLKCSDGLEGVLFSNPFANAKGVEITPFVIPYKDGIGTGYQLSVMQRSFKCDKEDVLSCGRIGLLGPRVCTTTGWHFKEKRGNWIEILNSRLRLVPRGPSLDLQFQKKPGTRFEVKKTQELIPSSIANSFTLQSSKYESDAAGLSLRIIYVSKPLNSDIAGLLVNEARQVGDYK